MLNLNGADNFVLVLNPKTLEFEWKFESELGEN